MTDVDKGVWFDMGLLVFIEDRLAKMKLTDLEAPSRDTVFPNTSGKHAFI